MRELGSCSGPWTGFWIQGSTRGWMRIQLTIRDGRISGKGSDQSGDFSMFGTYDAVTEKVDIDKNYPWLYIEYTGKWDGSMISGKWRFSMPDDMPDPDEDAEFPECGVFEIWPLDPFTERDSLFESMAAPKEALV